MWGQLNKYKLNFRNLFDTHKKICLIFIVINTKIDINIKIPSAARERHRCRSIGRSSLSAAIEGYARRLWNQLRKFKEPFLNISFKMQFWSILFLGSESRPDDSIRNLKQTNEHATRLDSSSCLKMCCSMTSEGTQKKDSDAESKDCWIREHISMWFKEKEKNRN